MASLGQAMEGLHPCMHTHTLSPSHAHTLSFSPPPPRPHHTHAYTLQVLKELAPYKSLVVATGGGAVTKPKNWSYMHNGIVAWLRGEPDLLARRVVAEGIEKRPLLFGEGVSGEGVWRGRGGGQPACKQGGQGSTCIVLGSTPAFVGAKAALKYRT